MRSNSLASCLLSFGCFNTLCDSRKIAFCSNIDIYVAMIFNEIVTALELQEEINILAVVAIIGLQTIEPYISKWWYFILVWTRAWIRSPYRDPREGFRDGWEPSDTLRAKSLECGRSLALKTGSNRKMGTGAEESCVLQAAVQQKANLHV